MINMDGLSSTRATLNNNNKVVGKVRVLREFMCAYMSDDINIIILGITR